MPFFQLSPGVQVREIDLTAVIPAVATTGGAFVGKFEWGPVEDFTIVDSRSTLENVFGKPKDDNAIDWFSANNYLAYSQNLNIVRVVEASALNAVAAGTPLLIKNQENYDVVATAGNEANVFAAKYPGVKGNSISVSIADRNTFESWTYKNDFEFAPGTSQFVADLGGKDDEIHVVVVDRLGQFTGVPNSVLERYAFLSKALNAKSADNEPIFYGNVLNKQSKYVWFLGAPVAGDYAPDSSGGVLTGVTVTGGDVANTSTTINFTFTTTEAGAAGGSGTFQTDASGLIVPGSLTITDGGSLITDTTQVTFSDDSTGSVYSYGSLVVSAVTTNDIAWGTNSLDNLNSHYKLLSAPKTWNFTGGDDGGQVTADELITGWNMFENSEIVDVSLLFVGDAGGSTQSKTVIGHVIDNIVERRKDCVVFFSPDLQDVQNQTMNQAAENVVLFRNTLNRNSSYAIMDSGWKYQYDLYNDKYRWIPLNADIAGTCANTDSVADPWKSPGGLTRGRIKNVIKLAFNPSKTYRDIIYKAGVNPVVSFNRTGQGTVLYGDKTQLAKASAFSRINVRRLFIILEKAIAQAAQYQLFEFNNPFTRARFKNQIEPFLREVKGREGIQDFFVRCDDTNNTPEIIDNNEFVADIFIKPQYSINFIRLNFVAVRTGVEFNEIIASGIQF